jgi:hypothetical protein
MGKRGNLYCLDWPRDRRIIERTIPFYPRAEKRQDEVADDPAFLPAVCHCLEQAVLRQQATLGTACSKQWHTVSQLPGVKKGAG